MALPNRTQISNAVESSASFIAKQLKGYTTENGILGPNHYSGGFCIVFPINKGKHRKALRVWHTEIENIKERYRFISRDIAKAKLSCLSNVEYIEQGLHVEQEQIDVVLMDWIDGVSLKTYINQIVTSNDSESNKKSMLVQLANNMLSVFQQMHAVHFAHGDLQYDNIIVQSDGSIKLIDYDNFYTPSLQTDFQQTTTGYFGYQHPIRKFSSQVISSEKDDYFAELVIYLSIIAFSEELSLWEISKDDDYSLLLTGDDLSNIQNSQTFASMKNIGGSVLLLCQILEDYLKANSLADLQPFDVVLDGMTKEPEIKRFGCSNQICLKGDKVIFSWDVQNFTQLLFDGQDVTAQSKIEITADTQTDYKLEVVNYQKRVSQSLRLKILPRPQVAFSASKNKLHANKNEQVELKWDVQHAESCSLVYADHTDDCRKAGTVVLTPEETATYILRVLALDKHTTVDTPITVAVYPDAQVQFSADKEYVFPSIPFTLSWQVQHAKKVELNGKVVKHTDSKTYSDGIDKNTTYTLRVTDEFGTKEYPLTIKQLPIPQIKTILVPTPKISEKINVNINIPDFKIVETPNLKVKSHKQNYLYLSSRKNSLIGRITFDKILTTIKNKISI